MSQLGRFELNRIYTGDCHKLATEIPDGSVDLIMTDPPWDDSGWFFWLSRIAPRILKPGGSLFSMCGKADFNYIMNVLGDTLTYHWLCIGYQPQSNLLFRPRRMMEKFRPAVWFTNGKRKNGRWISDSRRTNRDKRYHEWGQGESFFLYYMNKISGPQETIVLDPFCGGGTTPAVAKKLGIDWLAFELDSGVAEQARERVKNTQVPLPGLTVFQSELISWTE